ncbi:hypothetical protein K440DRAFT_661207 [Wilcoxina mikolae CBS 423.85]|nr:hypothetical protein K440DRAFT_661207 [Wilcoxina mikolae CBS 423.85]
MIHLRGGAGRPDFDGLKYDGGEPAQGDPGPLQTLPYFYGPRPWRFREEILSGALEIKNTTLIQDTGMALLNRILAPQEFTTRFRERRVERFGRWELDRFCVSSVTFDEELQFLDPNPPLRLEKMHKNNAPEVGNRRTWMTSELGPIVFDEVFRKLVDRGECDVLIVGRQQFMIHPFKINLTQKRREHFQYYMSGLDGVDEPPDAHISQFRQGKRFWAFFMHNGIEVAGWSDDLRVVFKVRGHENDESKKWRMNIQEKDEFDFERLNEELQNLSVDMKGLHYYIEDEEVRFRVLGVPPARQRVYYKLESDMDVTAMRYKLTHLVESGAAFLQVVVGPLPPGARVEAVDTEFDTEQEGRDNDHFWLAILDTHTGELFDHNSLDGVGRDRVLMENLRQNIDRLNNHYGLGLRHATRIIDAECHIQENGYDCGFIALNALLQFVICRIGAAKAPATRPMGKNNPAAKLLTITNFSEKQGGANDFRRMLNSIVHMWRRKQDGIFKGDPIGDTDVEESVLEAAVGEKKYYKIPTRKWFVEDDEWMSTNEVEDPFEQCRQLDYSQLAGKIGKASEMALALVDEHLGHFNQLERVRYHLDHAGAVVFSFKSWPDPLSVAGECPARCPHLLDIVPVPLNCKVILQPYKPQRGDSSASATQMAQSRANNLLLRTDKVMIGQCDSGFFAQANSGMHNNRTTLEFNGYPMASGVNSNIFRVLKLPEVGYFQVGDTFWGFVRRELPDIPEDCLRIPDRIFSANPALTNCRENDLLIGRYLSLQGMGPALRAWKAIGGRVYPTDHARGVKDLILPEGIEWEATSDDSMPESSNTEKPPRPKIKEPKKKSGGRGNDSIRDILGEIRTFPTTRVQQDDEPASGVSWDIDKSLEARQDRIKRYREQAERSWKQQLEWRRKTEGRTPEYDPENSIKSPQRDPESGAVVYEFSSSDEGDWTGETRRRKRAKIAESLLGAGHPAIQRDVDVTSVIHPSHPLRFFATLTTDQTPPPDVRPVRPGLSGGDGTTELVKGVPEDTTSQPPKPSPEVEVEKPEKPVKEPVKENEPESEPEKPTEPEPEKPTEPEPEPESEPESEPEPEPKTPARPPTPPTTVPTPVTPAPKPPKPKPTNKEDTSEAAFKAAKSNGLVICPSCGTSLKTQKVEAALKNHGPDTLCCVRNWNRLVKKKTAEMYARKKRFAALRKKGITKKKDIPKGNPDYSPRVKPAVIVTEDEPDDDTGSEYDPSSVEPETPANPPPPPRPPQPPKNDPPPKPTPQKPTNKNQFKFPDDDPRSEAVFVATRTGKNGRKICPYCGANLGSQAYNAAMANHGPDTGCNVRDWDTLVAQVTQEMKDRKKQLDKEKKRKRK